MNRHVLWDESEVIERMEADFNIGIADLDAAKDSVADALDRIENLRQMPSGKGKLDRGPRAEDQRP